MKIINKQKKYNCKLCNKEFGPAQFGIHIRKIHKLQSIIEYAILYDNTLLTCKKCIICNKERDLKSFSDKPNSFTCSKECDYKYKVKMTIQNNGIDFTKSRSNKALSSRTPGAFSQSQVQYWINRGFVLEEAKKKVSEKNRMASKRCIEHYLNKGNTEVESRTMLINYQRKCSPWCIEYWIAKGFSEDEAKQNISDFCNITSIEKFINRYGIAEGSNKYNSYIQALKDSNCFTVNGWVKKGFSLEKAIEKVAGIESIAHSHIRKLRKFERSLLPILNKLDLKFESSKIIKLDSLYLGNNKHYICLDYFISKYNLNIEMDGYFWHLNKHEEDNFRDIFLKNKGINIIRIQELEWNLLSEEQKIKFVGDKICELSL